MHADESSSRSRSERVGWNSLARRRGRLKGEGMGQPVVHFEIIGTDAKRLQSYYAELFGWSIDADNPANYGLVQREDNVNPDGIGIGGGVGTGPEGYDGHVTFYVEVPDVEEALAKAEGLGGTRMMGPHKVMDQVEIGVFADPEGHVVGVVKSA
jgi:predicted enzyme related to lactoylglutathione lyase